MTTKRPSDTTFKRMQQTDPQYGSQKHQREFLGRLDARAPGAICGNTDPDHEHVDACFRAPTKDKPKTP